MTTILKLSGMLMLTLTLTGCVQELEQLNRDLAAANARMADQRTASLTQARRAEAMATPSSPAGQEKPIQLMTPTDARTREAMDAALPTVKKILEIHPCIKTNDGVLQLNFLAVPGVNVRETSVAEAYPKHQNFMKYHDPGKCLSVRVVDRWVMPALNALQFRVVYFADDSGETVNYQYLMKKMDDGSWRLQQFRPVS